jgi:DNA invertase Pin-like site-specific DNA recombinase
MNTAVAIYARTNGTEPEPLSGLRQTVEDRGDVVFGVFIDDATIQGKGKNAAWRRLLDSLDQIDQIILNDAGDMPGRSSVGDVLLALATLTAHGVNIVVPSLGIDTADGSAAVLDLIAAYRRAKLGQAIRRGQAKAIAAGRRIGRPTVPLAIQNRIRVALADGAGVRPTARRFKVSPAYIVNFRRTMINTRMAAA